MDYIGDWRKKESTNRDYYVNNPRCLVGNYRSCTLWKYVSTLRNGWVCVLLFWCTDLYILYLSFIHPGRLPLVRFPKWFIPEEFHHIHRKWCGIFCLFITLIDKAVRKTVGLSCSWKWQPALVTCLCLSKMCFGFTRIYFTKICGLNSSWKLPHEFMKPSVF